jgi:hypothetical protein
MVYLLVESLIRVVRDSRHAQSAGAEAIHPKRDLF